MTSKIFCVLSNDKNLTGFSVDLDVSLTVGDLKNAIRTTKSRELDHLAADKLTLVRICNGGVGGLTKSHLKQSKEALSLANYDNEPKEPDITYDVSMFRSAPGACLIRQGLTFKVMNSMKKVSFFTASLPDELYHVLVLVPQLLATATVPSRAPAAVAETWFSNCFPVSMTPQGLCEWLHGSSSKDLSDSKVVSQEQTQAIYPTKFPLTGRDESLAHIKSCFVKTYEHRTKDDRNNRPIPMCTGVPGVGKTRILNECSSTVLDMTGIPGERLSVLISYGNDGNAYCGVDHSLGIQCSFAWRVLHSIFKAQFGFENWMRDQSPSNRNFLTLRLVLATIDYHWKQKTTGNVLVFVGVDEYQKLGQENLNLLLDLLCNSSRVSHSSLVTLFCMLAGTDLTMTRIARASHPNTERTPIRFLTHAEAMKVIRPFILTHHPGFIVSDTFAQNVFCLGGVPRLLTQFATKVIQIKLENMLENQLQEAREAVLCNLQYPYLSVGDILKLLAISFTNTNVKNELVCPFRESMLPSAQSLNWSQIISRGMCLIHDDGRVIVPFHLVRLVLARQKTEGAGLDEFELALLASLKNFSRHSEMLLPNVPAWLSWEYFGAHFYCLRINSFLVLGRREVVLSDILRGARMNSPVFESRVHIRIASVFYSNEQYGPDILRVISHKNADITVDWVDDANLQVVLNGDGGSGVDIFFALKREGEAGYIVVLDQRKRLGTQIDQSDLSTYMSKVPDKPTFLKNVETVVGLMSIYSTINVNPIPNSTFFVSTTESIYFHGSFFDHAGCTMAVDVNSGLKASIQQLFLGTQQKRKELAEYVIEHRKKKRIEGFEQLSSVVSEFGGELDELALGRITF
ncbi:UNVERIFIED_CONTAM: hypothetical protein HDU68_001620 [Siphonaria sp. JEL0065]|nr:hypothetical protein HDU68_001620 [Siphonaria sp. JEL0065]